MLHTDACSADKVTSDSLAALASTVGLVKFLAQINWRSTTSITLTSVDLMVDPSQSDSIIAEQSMTPERDQLTAGRVVMVIITGFMAVAAAALFLLARCSRICCIHP
eukprot:scaffold50816_cov46-Attheya_sp.AAC.3